MARIFISYRTADGLDKATALARDLGRVFGDAAVFLDKKDLRGGSAWREEIGRAIGGKPVVLLLVTPQLLAAVDDSGRRRIDDPDDPVRSELQDALGVGAQVIPVLCDGVESVPPASSLTPPFNRLGELTWRKLRAYDWPHDVERLVQDLRALGTELPAPLDEPSARRRALRAGGAAFAAAGVAGGAWLLYGRRSVPAPTSAAPTQAPASAGTAAAPPPTASAPAAPAAIATTTVADATSPQASPPTPSSSPPRESKPRPSASAAGLAGRWSAQLWDDERTVFVIEQTERRITLTSEPLKIAQRSDWAEYRAFWRERFKQDLDAVLYRGAGEVTADPGAPVVADIGYELFASPGGRVTIDGGNFTLTLSADGRRLAGAQWRNAKQAQKAVTLTRIGERRP